MVESYDIFHAVLLSFSSIHVLSAIVLFVLYPCARIHPARVIFFLIISTGLHDFFKMCLLLTSNGETEISYMDIANCELLSNAKCLEIQYSPSLFWASVFFTSSTALWFLMLALDVVLSLRNPFLPFQADHIKHHLITWPTSLIWLLVLKLCFQCSEISHFHFRAILDVPRHFVFLYIIIALVIAWRESRCLEIQSHMTTRLMAKRVLPYLFIFGLVVVLDFISYLIQLSKGNDDDFTTVLGKLIGTLECAIIFLFFVLDSGIYNNMKGKFLPNEDHDASSSFNVTASEGSEIESKRMANLIRQDVMRYTAMGILESSKSGRLSNEQGDSDVVFSNHTYSNVNHKSIIVHGIKKSHLLSFHDCCPIIFRDIRQLCGISEKNYAKSFEIENILSEHGSEGKSGNMFYFTANKQFMVKTVPKSEFVTLLSILPKYHSYIRAHKNTLLCKYYGCHSISLPVGKRRMYFVVMQNLFSNGAVEARFDLKGNTDRRQAIPNADTMHYIELARKKKSIGKLMLDIDFLTLHRSINLSISKKTQLENQLRDDVSFLSQCNIMDYSLLIGVKYLTPTSGLVVEQSNFYCSLDKRFMYHMGLIDILQVYNWKWTAQRWLLGWVLCKDMQNVSAVPPEAYSERLFKFIKNRLFLSVSPSNRSISTANSSSRKSSLSIALSTPNINTTTDDDPFSAGRSFGSDYVIAETPDAEKLKIGSSKSFIVI